MPLLAPVILSIGMAALFLDLESKLHVFRFYTAFRITSPMSWGAWILLLIYPATLLLALARLHESEIARLPKFMRATAEWAWRSTARIERANVILGIALGAYTGILLATLGARALWSSALLGPLFLVSGLSTGAALILLFPIGREEHEIVRRFDVMAIAGELVLLALLFVHLSGGDMRERAAAALFFGGAWTAAFWSLVVIAGLLVPLTFELWSAAAQPPLSKAAAMPPHSKMTSLLLLAGGFALRWIFVAAGQAV
jgi:formate-dependent nitrite reductase membrane component NrfD